jgi:choice-of-anchor B domain-containing protein
MRTILSIVFVLLVSSRSMNSQTSYNTTLIGTLNKYEGRGFAYASNSKSDYSEIWGWTDTVKNKEYAVIGTTDGTSIVDISTLPLAEVVFLPGPYSFYKYHEYRTYKNYLYIGSEGVDQTKRAGVQIVDLSPLPDSASFKKIYVWQDTNKVNGSITSYYRAHTVSIEKNFLYINGGDFGGTRILDITNPLLPLQVGSYGKGSNPYIHDSYTVNDTLYAAAINKGTLDIVDFKVKGHYLDTGTVKHKAIISSTPTPERRVHNVWTTGDNNYALTTDEITNGHLRIFNITNRTAPVQVAEWNSNASASIHNVIVHDNFAYIAYYGEGLRILDITKPGNPIEVGFYDTYAGPVKATHDPVYHGAWGVYPFFKSGKIVVSDMNTGLYVLSFNNKRGGMITASVHDPANNPLANVEILILETGRKVYTNSKGLFTLRTAAGVHTVNISKAGYKSKQILMTTVAGASDTVSAILKLDISPVFQSTEAPSLFTLDQNYPNPFNPTTKITFSLPVANFTSLEVFDVLGKKVSSPLQKIVSAGTHEVVIDASTLTSGLYYYTLRSGPFSSTKKMIVVR